MLRDRGEGIIFEKFVGAAIHHRAGSSSCAFTGDQQRNCPFQGRSTPRITFRGGLMVKQGCSEIEDENQLGTDRADGGQRNEGADRGASRGQRHALRVRKQVRLRKQTHPVHGHKDGVDARESKPKVELAERFVKATVEQFRKPEEKSAENRKCCGYAHHQVEMADDEFFAHGRAGKIVAREKNSRKATGDKERDESEGE